MSVRFTSSIIGARQTKQLAGKRNYGADFVNMILEDFGYNFD